MEKRNYMLLCSAVILATFFVFSPTSSGAFVTIGDKNWRQVTETTNVSWEDLDVIYDTSDGTLDNGTSAGGYDFTGWTWASATEVAQLFTDANPTLSITYNQEVYQADSAWAPNFLSLFDATVTNPSINERVWGMSRTVGVTVVNTPGIIDRFSTALEDRAHTNVWNPKDSKWTGRGVWLYQAAAVPEPDATTLIGISIIGIVGVGVVSRFRRSAENKVTS